MKRSKQCKSVPSPQLPPPPIMAKTALDVTIQEMEDADRLIVEAHNAKRRKEWEERVRRIQGEKVCDTVK
jgi:hypothetical protein